MAKKTPNERFRLIRRGFRDLLLLSRFFQILQEFAFGSEKEDRILVEG